jgi:hypothetical protein
MPLYIKDDFCIDLENGIYVGIRKYWIPFNCLITVIYNINLESGY